MAISNSVIRILAALVLPLVPLLQGCGATRVDRDLKQAVVVLAQRGDADSLAAAGLLRSSEREFGLALDLLNRATAVAPERADLAWLQVQICREVSTCDFEPDEARLRALDPSNGAGWLNALARADASKNEDAKIAILMALGRAERVDLYWTTLIAHLTRVITDTQKVSLPEALVDVIGVLAAEAIPAYSVTSNLCKGDRLNNNAELAEDCRNVALAFERGDTDLTEMIGVAIAKRTWPMDSPESKAAIDARRTYEYRSRLLMHSEWASLRNAHWAEKYLALCAQNRREQDVERAELISEGKNPDPPPNWVP